MAINLNVNGNTAPLEAAVQAAVTRIRRTPIKITVDDKGATQPLGNMKRGADEFSKSMEAANARIIAFGASMAIINGVSDAFKAMVKNVVEVEKSLADINVVMGLSANNLDKFSSSLFKVAKETGAAFNVAAEAATEYARQGLAVEETLKRTQDALILTRLTGMDSANAVKALTAAMNTYGDQIKDTTQLVSKFAAVDVKFAVSAEDFADAISRTGQAAKSAGVDIDELVGLVTAAQQKTARGGKVIGNSFKTIFTRIGRTDTLNQLENLGIAVRDVEGKTIGAKRILTDLANTFDHLTESQKAQIAQTVGGVFQINVLKAVLSDAAKQNGILANATQISAGATDEAITKNEQLRQTMAAMATETGLALKEMSASVGELMLAPGMEKILNIVKSVAEGANDMLGGGEASGNSFAKGFLKGVGNIITGPGLVVIVAVFTKLLVKAVQYARESLSSLIGVTSEAQKQKAIQTSLVNLFGQSSALSKEMLRTDISRTEKEKIILGLLKAQVVEANLLNTVAKSSASNLYRQGYGANLAPRKGRAGGHIPNFANPERAQAAQGGYAAGSIRSMNMPGEGSVIYNSAETVKNFAGFKQPAIMPPHSSKAGKNYQQAFGDIHGFDPYAAGGYIPNFFSKEDIGEKNAKNAKTLLNKDNQIILLTANYPGKDLDSKTYWVRDAADKEAGTGTRVHSGANTLRGSLTGKSFGKGNFKGKNKNAKPSGTQIDKAGVDMRQVKVPTFSLDKSDSKVNLPRNRSFQDYAYGKLKKYGKNLTIDMANRLMPNQKIGEFKLEDNDVAVMGGRIFEKVLEAITEEITGLSGGHKGALLDVPANPELFKVFGAKDGDGSIGAEAKISSDEKHVKSAARKIFDVLSKTEDRGKQLEKAFPAKKAGTTLSKTSQIRKSGGNAYGHIPNFANPLSDAIGREKEAGVPVSKIRIGSHSALMNKSNPIGLGVTNTDDEPNGLRDVFGAANGFVPNYVAPTLSSGDMGLTMGRTQQQLADQYNKELKKRIDRLKRGAYTEEQFQRSVNSLSSRYRISSTSQAKVDKEVRSLTGPLAKARRSISRIGSSFSSMNSKFGNTFLGKGLSGVGGMGLMMGAPMLAGFLQEDGASKGGASYNAGGALQGAGSGAAMGMMFGPIGVAAGGLIGAFAGLSSAMKESREAIKKEAEERRKASVRSGVQLGSSLAEGFSSPEEISFASSLNKSEYFGGGIRMRGRSSLKIKDPRQLIASARKGSFAIDDKKMRGQLAELVNSSETGSVIDESINSLFSRKKTEKNPTGRVNSLDIISTLRKSFEGSSLQGQEDEIVKMAKSNAQRSGTDLDAASFRKAMTDQSVAKMGTEARKEMLLESLFAIKKANPSEKINYQGKDFSPDQLIEKVGDDPEEIKAAYKSMLDTYDKMKNAEAKKAEGVIIQLNLQKAQIAAQQAAAVKQLEIKENYSKISDNLKFEEKLMGSLMTDQQKAQSKYLQAINKAEEAYSNAAASADSQLRTGILAQLKGNDTLQGEFKKALRMDDKSEFQDISERVGSLTGEELKSTLESIASEAGDNSTIRKAINKLLSLEITKMENILSLAERQKGVSTSQADREREINGILAGRAEIIKDLERKNRMSSEGLRSSQKIRGFTEQVAAARRLNAEGPGYQTGRERESFAMSEKRFKLESKITTLEENRDKTLAGLGADKLGYEMEEKRLGELDTHGYPIEVMLSPTEQIEYKALNDSTEERKKKLEEIEQEIKNINTETKTEISSAQELLEKEKERLKLKREYETGPGAMRNGARDAQKRIVEQAETMEFRLGGELTNQFRNGLVDGMQAAINKADDLSDVMNNIAMNFLGAIQKAYLGKAADAIVGALPFSSGGGVRKYSKGGGVPAMVTNGEYVMGRDAVKKYGGGFMHRLNAGGKLPGYSTGGKPDEPQPGSALAANFGGGEGYNTGRRYQSQAMSGFFYSGQAGNVGLQEDTQYTKGIIQERMRKEAEKKAKKRALMQMIVGTALSVGIGSMVSGALSGGPLTEGAEAAGYTGDTPKGTRMAVNSSGDYVSLGPGVDSLGYSNSLPTRSGMFGGFKNMFSGSSDSNLGQSAADPYLTNFFKGDNNRYFGGNIGKYANGGHIAGKSGIDQIPAMLSEGEYVIRASSARQLGKPMLDRINAGKFNDGGAVTPLTENSETGTSGGNTNNINVTVNMQRGKGKSEEKDSSSSGGTNPKDASAEEERTNNLAEKVKEQVITVIMEEQRPGGLLSD